MFREDELDRGPHAAHVHKHRKLEKHRTVLRIALPLMNAIVSMPEVQKISFNKIFLAHGSNTRGFWVTRQPRCLRLAAGDGRWIQLLQIFLRSSEGAEQVVGALKAAAGTEGVPLSIKALLEAT